MTSIALLFFGLTWNTDLDQALKTAQANNKLVLVYVFDSV